MSSNWKAFLREQYRRPALAILAVVIVTASLLMAAFLRLSYIRDLEAGHRRAEGLARLLEEQTLRNFQAVDLVLQGIGDAVRPDLKEHDPAFRAMLKRRLESLPHVRALFVIGSDGFIVHDTDYPTTPRVSLADRDYFQAHRTNPGLGLYIGTPLRSRSVDRWFVSVSRRVDPSRETFDGIAVAAVEPSFYQKFFADLGLGSTDAVTLLHRDGTLIARVPENRELIGRRLPGLTLFQELATQPHGTYTAASEVLDGQQRVVAYRSTPGLPLVIAVSLSRDAILANWRSMAYGAAGSVALVLALGTVAALLLIQRSRERRQTRQRAVLSQKLEALGQMTGGISHDFGNILAVAKAGLTLADKHANDPVRVRTHIAQAQGAVDLGVALTSQLLAFAKRQELHLTNAEINHLLLEIEPMLRQAAGAGIALKLDLSGPLPECQLDRVQFEAAILNLVINARDAMPDGGTVEISTALRGGEAPSSPATERRWVVVRVRDTGPGIPAESLKRVFEPFFTTKGERGTGLGLAQVQSFMQQMGGEARITSAVGVGTMVELLFPLTDTARLVPPVQPQSALSETHAPTPQSV